MSSSNIAKDSGLTGEPEYGTIASLWHLYDTMPRQLAFRAETMEEWRTWRELLHARLIDLLGGFPLEPSPLQPVVLETSETPDYMLEKVAFQSEPGAHVPCYVLTPRHVKPPYRAVISLHGHGTGGAAHTIGRTVGEDTRAEEEEFIRSSQLRLQPPIGPERLHGLCPRAARLR